MIMLGFIVNPMAGNGKGNDIWRIIERSLRGSGAVYQMRKTSGMGEAQKLAVELIQKEGVTKIIAVGGDGTVHEVLNGVQQSGRACLFGVIPAGSGNDYAKGHGIAVEPVMALEQILREEKKKIIDLLRINGRVAVNVVGAGFDAQVAKTTNEASYKGWLNKGGLGKVAYILSVLRVICSFQPTDVTLVVDGQKYRLQKVWLIAIANIPNFGGGMLICPGAVPNDGVAEICVVSNVNRWQLLRAFPLIFTGSHVKHPGVRFFRGQHIQLDSQTPLFVQADGEVIAHTPFTVEMVPGCQTVCG
ncbi:diacylglycerol/lipid kinase family protein [Brevibacillus panacihumi]|uniref:diacylglycerol/lipid kinase family protein n=3 Tax=Brevibacillus panacihumi TaxID=497735 RepID=UPI003D02C947